MVTIIVAILVGLVGGLLVLGRTGFLFCVVALALLLVFTTTALPVLLGHGEGGWLGRCQGRCQGQCEPGQQDRGGQCGASCLSWIGDYEESVGGHARGDGGDGSECEACGGGVEG